MAKVVISHALSTQILGLIADLRRRWQWPHEVESHHDKRRASVGEVRSNQVKACADDLFCRCGSSADDEI
jgi:hypothetical protein